METSTIIRRKVGSNTHDVDDPDGSVRVLGIIGIDQTQVFWGSWRKNRTSN